MQDEALLREELARLKSELEAEKANIGSLDELVKRQIEREPGLWEYGFDELGDEIWKRFHTLEKNTECLSEEQYIPPQRIRAAFLRRLNKLYRYLTLPLARVILDKKKQFNLDQQDLLNKENIPLSLAVILTLQKIKDRLNVLEEKVNKLVDEQEDE
jgi:hypothetical protein